ERGGTLNNFYIPYLDVASLQDPLRRGRDRDLSTTADWVDITELQQLLDEEGLPVFDEETEEPGMVEVVIAKEVTGGGCIGFSADVDVFRLVGGNPCGTGNCAMTLEVNLANRLGSDLDLAWFLLNEGMSPVTSFLESQRGGK